MKHFFQRFLMILLCIVLMACTSQQETNTAQTDAQMALTNYLDAFREQDEAGLKQLDANGRGVDFSITQGEAEQLGMDKEQAQDFYRLILNFEAQIEQVMLTDGKAEGSVHIKAYDIDQILQDAQAANAEEFTNIQGRSDLDEKEKSNLITERLLNAFSSASRTYEFDIVFKLQWLQGEWKISEGDVQLLTMLFSSAN